MSSTLNDSNPGLARKLYDAFDRSRELAYDDATSDKASFSQVIYARELMRDQLKKWGDVYAHGIKANKSAIDFALDYSHEQGITKDRLSVEQMFAADTLDT